MERNSGGFYMAENNGLSGDGFEIRVQPLTDAVPDPNNANEHTERGIGMLAKSVRERGIFRPIAAAGGGVEKPVVMAGSATQETLVEQGFGERAIFVYTDGDIPIVHVRRDLDPKSPEAKRLGIEDNRIAEIDLSWNDAILAQLASNEPETIGGLFSPKELGDIFESSVVDDIPDAETERPSADEIKISATIPNDIAEAVMAFLDGLKGRGLKWTRK